MAHLFKALGRNFSTSQSTLSIRNVTIIGGGLMGSGIAQVAAQTGHIVTLVDLNENILKKAGEGIQKSLQRVVKKTFKDDAAKGEEFVKNTMSNIKYSSDIQESVKESDLVIEAIVEKLAAKHALFSSIDNVAPQHTIFATNTSSLAVTDISSVISRKDRFGGLHFFNPVPVMKLVEIIRTEQTSDDTYKTLMAWGRVVGKTCVTCKDTPGFIVNRLLIPQLLECVRLMERGDATAKDIDIAMKLGAGHPMGPFELADYVGLDTLKLITDGWHQKYPDVEIFKPVETLNKLVAEAKFGVKSGEGFYKYKK